MLNDGKNSVSHMTFAQDTGIALIGKGLTSRSPIELSEVSFLEILESALIYYSVPLLGGPIFKRLFGAFLPKADRHFLTETLDKIPQDKLRHILPAKAAVIATALTLTGIGGEYVINYARNLVTAKVFKKDQFSDVVNLSKGEIKSGEKSSVVEKSWHRIRQVAGVCAGIFAASLLGARFGPKRFSDGFINGPIKSLVRSFDFKFSNGSYGLTKNQMAFYMALSVPAYLDSARDNLERWESATRLSIVLPYLLWGQGWLEGLTREYFPKIVAYDKNGANRVKSVEELAQEAMNALPQTTTKILTLSDMRSSALQAAADNLKKPLQQKMQHVGIPLAVGVLGTGIGVGLLNRFFTQRRFEQQRLQQSQYNPSGTTQPGGTGISTVQSRKSLPSPGAKQPVPGPQQAMSQQSFSMQTQPLFQQRVPTSRPYMPPPTKPMLQGTGNPAGTTSFPPIIPISPFVYPAFRPVGDMSLVTQNGIWVR